jgi:hypothetical protein
MTAEKCLRKLDAPRLAGKLIGAKYNNGVEVRDAA